MKTAIQGIIESIKEAENRNIEITNKGILTIIENAKEREKEQILNAFNEGMKYGNSPLQTFDYPASRYYMFTYTEENTGVIPKYLVRPTDFHIFELDESNGCYRSYINRDVEFSDGTRPNAMAHFTLENLTMNYNFFPITEKDIPICENKNDDYCKFILWQSRPDGHGGSKGGTYEEYLNNK